MRRVELGDLPVVAAEGRAEHTAPDDVLELADVARPVAAHEVLACPIREAHARQAEAARRRVGEVPGEHEDVRPPLAKRRDVQWKRCQPVEQVRTEAARRHLTRQVAVGRGNHAHVDAVRPVQSHPLNLAVLQHAQELGLDLQRQLADLGTDPRKHPSVYRRIGFVPEDDAVYGHLSTRQLVRYAAELSRCDASAAVVDRAIAKVNMLDAADRPIAEYSKGMRQRAKVAAALVNEPDLLVLDEPLNGADPRSAPSSSHSFTSSPPRAGPSSCPPTCSRRWSA